MDVAPFGLGFISEYTTTTSSKNNIHAVACAKVIVEWCLAHGKPAVVFVPLNKITKATYDENLQKIEETIFSIKCNMLKIH